MPILTEKGSSEYIATKFKSDCLVTYNYINNAKTNIIQNDSTINVELYCTFKNRESFLKKISIDYKKIIDIAREHQYKSVTIPLLGSYKNINILSLLKVAKQSLGKKINNQDDLTVYLAIDEAAQQSFSNLNIPHFNIRQRTVIPNSYRDSFSFIVRSSADYVRKPVPKVLKDIANKNITMYDSKTVSELLLTQLNNIPEIALYTQPKKKSWGLNQVSAYLGKTTYYNIFSGYDKHKINKATILTICIGLKMNLERTEEVLKAAGFSLTNSTYDEYFKYVIEHNEDLNTLDFYLTANNLKDLNRLLSGRSAE